MDLDIDSPNLPRILGLTEPMKLNSKKQMIPAHKTNDLKVFSMGLFIDGKNKAFTRVGELNRALIGQAVNETVWTNVELFLIDLPAGTGDELTAMLNHFPNLLGTILVTQPTTTEDLLRCIDLTSFYCIPILGVIENMHGAVCDCGEIVTCKSCGNPYSPLGKSTVKDICKESGIKYLGALPIVTGLAEQINKSGDPEIPDKYAKPIKETIKLIKKLVPKEGVK